LKKKGLKKSVLAKVRLTGKPFLQHFHRTATGVRSQNSSDSSKKGLEKGCSCKGTFNGEKTSDSIFIELLQG